MSGVTTSGGRVERDGAGTSLVFRRVLPYPVEVVWRELTDPDRLERWYGRWEGDPATGAVVVRLVAEGDVPAEPLRIDWCEPPSLLAVTVGGGGTGGGTAWPLTVALAAKGDGTEGDGEGDGTTLVFRHLLGPDVEGGDVGGIGAGWHYYLDRLEASLRDEPVPDDWDDYAGLAATYGPAHPA
ncbi:SRPBCC domain-containing protein [Cellulomonas marina]|uniref:Uncharacterized conserved protein YndB, AHSA1/START domain n=1 Tax=Cellulomonas marina TaxID=988821 RepID=A0A1I0Y3J0_9CELL|nr:SRPBCC domain-containing protein [Cellulomonas marina]GIG28393.1 ATPase [Cellulomonas marina]SFB07256.1 Uncharacterized conserved protein YndB, AHSA1/START domain [Cellulomonas marina]